MQEAELENSPTTDDALVIFEILSRKQIRSKARLLELERLDRKGKFAIQRLLYGKNYLFCHLEIADSDVNGAAAFERTRSSRLVGS